MELVGFLIVLAVMSISFQIGVAVGKYKIKKDGLDD